MFSLDKIFNDETRRKRNKQDFWKIIGTEKRKAANPEKENKRYNLS